MHIGLTLQMGRAEFVGMSKPSPLGRVAERQRGRERFRANLPGCAAKN